MSTVLETRIPDVLAGLLSPGAPLTEGFTLLLVTLSADGYPHVAMLSCGEVVANSDHHLSLAVWPGSTAAVNLAERPRATMSAVADSTSWTLNLSVTDAGEVTTPSGGTLRRFEADLVRVTGDQAPYATLESGVTFRLRDHPAVMLRWRQLRAALAGGMTDD